jgi:transcriptional regulator with XRE-family HTH domain
MMEELNYSSGRSFALYLGVSYSTVNRLLHGARIDPESLLPIANALHVPVENLYRLADFKSLE